MKPLGLLSLVVCASLAASPLVPRAALAQELLHDGGFEDGDAWSGCGGTSRVDGQDLGTTGATIHGGRYAARIGGPSDGTCGSVPTPQLIVVQPVAIPADAIDLTLSFWFSRLGADLDPDGNSVADLSVSLSTDPYLGTALFDDYRSPTDATTGTRLLGAQGRPIDTTRVAAPRSGRGAPRDVPPGEGRRFLQHEVRADACAMRAAVRQVLTSSPLDRESRESVPFCAIERERATGGLRPVHTRRPPAATSTSPVT